MKVHDASEAVQPLCSDALRDILQQYIIQEVCGLKDGAGVFLMKHLAQFCKGLQSQAIISLYYSRQTRPSRYSNTRRGH